MKICNAVIAFKTIDAELDVFLTVHHELTIYVGGLISFASTAIFLFTVDISG